MSYNLQFASLLAYTAHGTNELAEKSISLRNFIKRCDSRSTERFIEVLKEEITKNIELRDLFADTALVPVPRSSPLPPKEKVNYALWPALRYCEAIQEAGVKAEIYQCVKRVTKVPKSAFAAPGERLFPEDHRDSFKIKTSLDMQVKKILRVDDFITRGSTMLGAAMSLKNQLPDIEIKGFAVVRTLKPEDLKSLIDPCFGQILYKNGSIDRVP